MTLEQRILQLEQAFRSIFQQIQTLSAEIVALKACCCKNQLFFLTAISIYYFPDQDNGALNLNDRFPLDNMCNGAKGILVVADATIYCEWQDWNGGWTVITATYGGNQTCGCV